MAEQNLTFRSTNSKLFERTNGNFFKCLEMIAKFDGIHINKNVASVIETSNNCYLVIYKYLLKGLRKILYKQREFLLSYIIFECNPLNHHTI